MCNLRWNEENWIENDNLPTFENPINNSFDIGAIVKDVIPLVRCILTDDMECPSKLLQMVDSAAFKGNELEREAMLQSQIIDILLIGLNSRHEETVNKVLDILLTLALSSAEYWQHYVPKLGIPQLIQYLYQCDINSDENVSTIVRIIGKVIQPISDDNKTAILSIILPHLQHFIQTAESSEILEQILQLFGVFVDVNSHRSAHHVKMFAESGTIPLLLNTLKHYSEDVVQTSVALVAKITALSTCNALLLENDILALIAPHVGDSSMESDVISIIAQISGGEPAHVLAIIESNILPSLINALDNSGFTVQRMVARIMMNCSKMATTEQLMAIIDTTNVIAVLCSSLKIVDAEMIFVSICWK